MLVKRVCAVMLIGRQKVVGGCWSRGGGCNNLVGFILMTWSVLVMLLLLVIASRWRGPDQRPWRAYACVCVRVFSLSCVHACVCARVCVCVSVCGCLCVCVVCVRMRVCVRYPPVLSGIASKAPKHQAVPG